MDFPKSAYGDDLIGFSKLGGKVTVGNVGPYKNYGVEYVVNGSQIYAKAHDQQCVIYYENEKNIAAIHDGAIIFDDGSVDEQRFRAFQNSLVLEGKMFGMLRDSLEKAKNDYLEAIDENLDGGEETPDGYNVKELMLSINRYLNSSYHAGSDSGDMIMRKNTYEALTAMIKNKDEAKEYLASQFEVQPKTLPGKNLAIGILLLIGAAALIGLAVACCTVLAALTAGGSAMAGAAAIMGAVSLIAYAGFKFNHYRFDKKYTGNLKTAATFFNEKAKVAVEDGGERNNNDNNNNEVVVEKK